MRHRTRLTRFSTLLVGSLAAAVMCWTASAPEPLFAQGRDRGAPPQRRDDPPPQKRDDPPPQRRDDPPPQKRDDPPPQRRDDPPPRREEPPPPRREEPPPPRREETPPPPRREETPPPPKREEAPPPKREEVQPPRREETQPPRREEAVPPKREQAPPVKREDVQPPRREEAQPPKRQESQPPRRLDTAPPQRREETSPQKPPEPGAPKREETPPIRRWEPPAKRVDPPGAPAGSPTKQAEPPAPQRDNPPARPGGTTPRQGVTPPQPRHDTTPPAGSTGLAPKTDDRGTTGSIMQPPVRRDPSVGGTRPVTRDRGGTGGRPGAVPNPAVHTGSSSGPTPPRPGSGQGAQPPRPVDHSAQGIFTHSMEGKTYQNGVTLRPGRPVGNPEVEPYFPDDYSFYPYYGSPNDTADTYPSPYDAYEDVCPPSIEREHADYTPPAVVYVEPSTYGPGRSGPRADDARDYYLNREMPVYEKGVARVASLDQALRDLRNAFRRGSIGLLAAVTDPRVRIAVFRSGKYQYSLRSADYLDMTRDALRAIDTVRFDLGRVRRKAVGVYAVNARHQYRDVTGQVRTAYLTFILQRRGGRYVITQIGVAGRPRGR